jgi:Kef-type K+ transport system membrane component KefB/mannitol/fructose-specific phosphotransferase system IIA component (Ntr-type)
MNITELMTELVFQIGVILFAVRLGGRLARKLGIPSVLGELLIGVIIGPYALGGIAFPGFPHGVFPLNESGSIAVSTELYAFATVASIILLFSSGLETDLGLFLKYSVAGGVIGLGGALFSFTIGDLCGVLLLKTSFLDTRCLFLGILSTATSVGITARILNDQKKMDSPEGVTILAAAVFDDVLGIIMLAVVLGIVALFGGSAEGDFSTIAILGIAGKAFGIWLGFTVIGLVFSRQLASFLKIFKNSFDFAILALGIALILAGFFEKHGGLAMIIGAYITGLSLSKTDIAAVIQGRLQGLYEFFVPLFFAVMGMMVNIQEILSVNILIFGGIYTLAAIFAKIIGCGGPALLLGFNIRGALRIGVGMVPRGEVALIIAGIGLAMGILDNQLFSIIIMLTLISTIFSPPLLNVALKIKGHGTRKFVRDEGNAHIKWDFDSHDVAKLMANRLLIDIRAEGFFVQTMNIDDNFALARKDDISLSISCEGSAVIVKTSKSHLPFVKNVVYEDIITLSEAMQKLKDSMNTTAMKKELFDRRGRASNNLLSLIEPDSIILDLKGTTKEEIIKELVDILFAQGKLLDRELVLADVLERESIMSTGMGYGIAIPHAKTDGVKDTVVAVGIKKEGINLDPADGQPSRIFILEVSPKKEGPHLQFLSTLGAVLRDESIRQALINAVSAEEAAKLLHNKKTVNQT